MRAELSISSSLTSRFVGINFHFAILDISETNKVVMPNVCILVELERYNKFSEIFA